MKDIQKVRAASRDYTGSRNRRSVDAGLYESGKF